ncbi:hypothetical protein [Hyalangium versicolor]|uniref:hypothetical protein n=1 Tax=Hyalangium versicolor TaxID=2861190 RepID=UPI001CC99B76|nr:hypothetical protein [Hyalangium versicolor]
MQRLRALGLTVLVCLAAQNVTAAEAKKNTEEKQQPKTQQQAEQEAEALKQQAQALRQEQLAVQEEKKPAGPEPKLNLPIRYFVYSALLGGLGYATGFLARGPERDLRDPAKHSTQDKTQSLYRRAYYGGLISKGFYSLSGAMGGYAAYRTQSSIRQYLTAKAQMAARQKETDARVAQARSPEERLSAEVSQSLVEPQAPLATELLVMVPEPPPLQAGFSVGPSGEGSLSLALNF